MATLTSTLPTRKGSLLWSLKRQFLRKVQNVFIWCFHTLFCTKMSIYSEIFRQIHQVVFSINCIEICIQTRSQKICPWLRFICWRFSDSLFPEGPYRPIYLWNMINCLFGQPPDKQFPIDLYLTNSLSQKHTFRIHGKHVTFKAFGLSGDIHPCILQVR